MELQGAGARRPQQLWGDNRLLYFLTSTENWIFFFIFSSFLSGCRYITTSSLLSEGCLSLCHTWTAGGMGTVGILLVPPGHCCESTAAEPEPGSSGSRQLFNDQHVKLHTRSSPGLMLRPQLCLVAVFGLIGAWADHWLLTDLDANPFLRDCRQLGAQLHQISPF